MRTKLVVVAVVGAVGGLLAAAPAVAHHAFAAEFDANSPVELDGTVVRMEWVNPHVWIHLDVTMADGTTERWMVEGGTPNALFRRGFTRQGLTPGTELFVDGYRSKDGSRKANGRDITLPDGTTLFVGSSGTGAPYDGQR